MTVKHGLSITASRFSLVFKVVLCILIITMLFTVLAYSAILPTLSDVMKQINELHPVKTLGKYIVSLFKNVGSAGEGAESLLTYNQLVETFRTIGEILSANMGRVGLSIFFLVVFVLLYVAGIHAVSYNVASVLDTFMCSDGEYGLIPNIVSNFRKSLRFALFSMMISVLFFSVGACLSVGIGWLVSKLNLMLGLMSTSFCLLLTVAAKRALLITWLPAVICEKRKVLDGFSAALGGARKTFKDALGAYFVIYLLLFVLGGAIGIATFGMGIVLIFAFGMVFMESYDLVTYYQTKGRKYYIDDQTVIDPRRRYRDAVIENPLDREERAAAQPRVSAPAVPNAAPEGKQEAASEGSAPAATEAPEDGSPH